MMNTKRFETLYTILAIASGLAIIMDTPWLTKASAVFLLIAPLPAMLVLVIKYPFADEMPFYWISNIGKQYFLNKLFRHYNEICFSNILPDIPIIMKDKLCVSAENPNALVLGSLLTTVSLRTNKIVRFDHITINGFISLDELKHTLIHEMCHAMIYMLEYNNIEDSHGPRFQYLMKSACEKANIPYEL
jgi:hypothetical protein